MDALFFIVFAAILINWGETIDNPTEILSITSDDDIYKCVSYTGTHIDISHWINQDFSDYKDCQTPGLYTLNRIDRYFKVEIAVQRSWIYEVSAIIFNGTIKPLCGLNSDQFSIRPTETCALSGINVTVTETDRFETLSLYYDIGNLAIITTHDKQGDILHFNVNIWQTRSDINSSYGLCTGATCSSGVKINYLADHRRSSYPADIVELICDTYIDNYLNSTGREPWERSVHYNTTVMNVRKACISDVQREDRPHVAGGSLEVLFVEDQVNADKITTMADIQINFQTNLEEKLLKLAETMNRSRVEVDDIISRLTTTSTSITTATTTTTVTTVTTATSPVTNTTTVATTMSTTTETESTTLSTITSTTTLTSTIPPSTTVFVSTTEPSKTQTSSTPSSTTQLPNSNNTAIMNGGHVRGGVILIGLVAVLIC